MGFRIVHLDVSTLVVMGSFASACAGIALLVAWWQNPKVPALGFWGLGNMVNAVGILGLILGPAGQRPVVSIASSALLTLGMGLIWKAARSLDDRWAPLGLAVLGGVAVGLAGAVPATRSHLDILNLTIGACYMLAASGSLWFARRERLAARWPLIILTAIHAAILASGAYAFFDGSMGHGRIPAVMSLFGLIHFESIVFVLGTAVFLLALVKERSEAASRIAAVTDPLTGVTNRGGFMLSAERVVERCRIEGTLVSVMMFDLDRFKGINDTHGHAAGDAVLLRFCEVAAAALRANDVFGRIGGEEFAAVLPGSGIEAAYVRAERIRILFAETCRYVGDRQVGATVSGGVATGAAHQTVETLLAAADAALYIAKVEGRNRIKRSDDPPPNGSKSTVIRVA
jgi:diguanylate cyclase (GGDEF)-like protein